MSNEGLEQEYSEESTMEDQIENLEQTFGEIIPRHKKVLEEEEDVVKKLEIAHKLIENSEAVTKKLTNNAQNNGSMSRFIEDGFKNLVALMRAVEMEINDIHENLQEENQEITNLQRMEDRIRKEADFMLDQHEAMFGERLADSDESDDIDSLANDFQRESAEDVKNTLSSRLDHYWNDLNLDEVGV